MLASVLDKAVGFESAALILAAGISASYVIRAMRSGQTDKQIEERDDRLATKIETEVIRANGVPLAFLDNSPAPAWYKDRNLVMRYISPGYSAMFGVTPSQYVGRQDHDVWPEEVANQFREHDMRVMRERVRIEVRELVPERANDPAAPKREWYVVKFPVINSVTGDVDGVAGTCFPHDMVQRAVTAEPGAEIVSPHEIHASAHNQHTDGSTLT